MGIPTARASVPAFARRVPIRKGPLQWQRPLSFHVFVGDGLRQPPRTRCGVVTRLCTEYDRETETPPSGGVLPRQLVVDDLDESLRRLRARQHAAVHEER